MKLEFIKLSKKYGEKYALQEFDAIFQEGIYGILGPNGAGKSTLMNMMTDNLTRTSGKILLDGKDILDMGKQYRSILGYMPQQQGFYEQFSATAFLKYIGKLKGYSGKKLNNQVEQLLKKVNLYDYRYEKVGSFSGGMRQRVLLAQALIGDPKIIILDEPTAGLDPKERINIRNIIAELSKDKIIFIATHVVSDIECIANKIMLVKSGQLIRLDTPAELIASVRGKVGEIHCEKDDLLSLQETYKTGTTVQKNDGMYFRIVGDKLPDNAREVTDNLTLEDVYLYYLAE